MRINYKGVELDFPDDLTTEQINENLLANEHLISQSPNYNPNWEGPVAPETDVDGMAQVPAVAPAPTQSEPVSVDTGRFGSMLGLDVKVDSDYASLSDRNLVAQGIEAVKRDSDTSQDLPINIDDGAKWEDIIQSEQFLNETPRQKRRIADAYFDKMVAPSIPAEQADEARNRFKTQSGLVELTSDGVAKEAKGFTEQVGDYFEGKTAADVGKDVMKIGSTVASDVKAGFDWLTDTSVNEKIEGAKAVGGMLYELGADIAEFGVDTIFGLSDADFEREYGMPKSEAQDRMGALERFRYKKLLQKKEGENIDAALAGQEAAPIELSTVREEAEQSASDITRDLTIDALTLPFAAGKGTQALAGLAKIPQVASTATRRTALAAGAIATGEAVKNVADGRDLGENMLAAVAIDRALAGAEYGLGASSRQAQKAAKTVVKGKKAFNDTLENAGNLSRLDTEIDNVLNGRTVDTNVFKEFKQDNPSVGGRIKDASEAGKIGAREFEAAYKTGAAKNMNGDEFARFVKQNSKSAAVKKIPDEKISNWFHLRRGDMDSTIQTTKTKLNVNHLRKMEDPNVANYLRAAELDELGTLGKMMSDVSDTAGATNLSKMTAALQDLTNFGITRLVRDKIEGTASKKMTSEAKATINKSFDDLMSDISSTTEMTQKKMFRRENLLDNRGEVQADLDNVLADIEDGVIPNDPKLVDSFTQRLDSIDETLARLDDEIRAETVRQPLRREAVEELQPLLKKEKLSDKEALTAASALKQTEAGNPLFDDFNVNKVDAWAGDVVSSNRDNLERSIAALSGKSKRTAGKMSTGEAFGRSAVMGVLVSMIGWPVGAFKAATTIANSMAQTGQKRGLIQGVKLANEHAANLRRMESSLKKAGADTAEGKQIKNQMDKANVKFEKSLNTLGVGVVEGVSRVMTEAARVTALMTDMEE